MERTKAQNILNEGFIHTVKDPLWQNIPMTREIKALIEVDGGVNLETGARLMKAGADVLVAGNAVFSAPSPEEMIHALKNL